MRTIEYTSQFKRDFKRVRKGSQRQALEADLLLIIKALAMDKPLAAKHRDHMLAGNWSDHRDCHIKPDLVLIYRKPAEGVLQLVRLGSHSDLGL